MNSSFTVIVHQIAHIGEKDSGFGTAPFKGPVFDSAPFSCPGVDTSERAVLMFQSRNVRWQRNVLRINDSDVFGGIPVSTPPIAPDDFESQIWNGNVLLVEAQVLKPTGNVLHIEARNFGGSALPGIPIDNFLIDNIVVFFKTNPSVPLA